MRPAVISFYSYKGGVGRTLLAANLALALAREGKTLLWDMDVEAPGLHNIQALRSERRFKAGFFDWLQDWQKNKTRPPGPKDLSQFSELVQPTPFSQLHVLPAHGDEADAAALYFGIDWQHLLGGSPPPGQDLFNALIEHLGREGFRQILIDTRTGLTDLGALLAGVLPDATVLVGGYGQQNLRGLGRVYQGLTRLDRAIRPSNTDLRLFPVASPIPQDHAERVAAGRELWSKTFGVQDIASVREIRYDPALPFSEDLFITQQDRAIAKDYERVYRELSQFVDTLFASQAAEQAERDTRPDIFDRDPLGRRASRAAQGKRFEERIADLLRLLGYGVEREQLIGPDRVDLVARIESGLDTITYFVECKDHKGAVSKEVVDLLGLWLTKPSAQALHARGMVVANAFSPAALASAKDQGITTATPQDLERRLLDFDRYLFQLVADFEQSPLASCYVTQRSKPERRPQRDVLGDAEARTSDDSIPSEAIEDLIAHGIEWAHGRDSRLWVLLGDYGTGKTAFTEKLAYELAKRAVNDLSAPVPLRVSLRDFPNKVKLEDLLADRWLQATGQRKDPRVLLHLIQRGRIVLLFDAFDEMGIATAGRSVVEQFRMLVGITANAGETATGNRVLITCREQFFKDHGDAIKAAAGDQDRIPSSALQDVAQRFDGAIHTVATFSPEQVRQFLVLRLGEAKGQEALSFLQEQRMMELGDRPQLLDIIIGSLPALKERQARNGERLSTGALYQAYTNRWLDDASFRPVERQSTGDMLRAVLEELALLLWQRVGNRIHYGDLFALVKQRVDLRGQLDPNQLDVELRTAAFLSRTPDGLYGFSHRSFLEFFLARRIERSMCASANSDVAEVLNIPRLSGEVCSFVHDLVPVTDVKRRTATQAAVLRLLAPSQTPAPAASRVNALWFACSLARHEADDLDTTKQAMRAWIPDGAQLAGLDLSDMSLSGLRALRADMQGSDFTDSDLRLSDLSGANLDKATLRRARLIGADLANAQLRGVVAHDSVATHVDLSGADATASSWLNADLQHAKLSKANFALSDLRAACLADCQGTPTLEGARTLGLTARRAEHWPTDLQALTTPNPRTLAVAPAGTGTGAFNALAFSPDGHQVASLSASGVLQLWDCASGLLVRVLAKARRRGRCLSYSPDGRRIASGTFDGIVQVWDTTSGHPELLIDGPMESALCLAFSPDGRLLACGGHEGAVSICEVASGQALQTMGTQEDTVTSVAFHPEGHQLVSGHASGAIRLWDVTNGQELSGLYSQSARIRSLAFHAEGELITAVCDGDSPILWNARTGEWSRLAAVQSSPTSAAATVSPDGSLIAHVDIGGALRLWDTTSGELMAWPESDHGRWPSSLAFSGGGSQIASGSDDGILRLWTSARDQPPRVIGSRTGAIYGVAYSPDGSVLASIGSDGNPSIWSAASGKPVRFMNASLFLGKCVAFSPDGRQLASGGSDSALRLWDSCSGELTHIAEGHTDWIRCIAYSPDGKLITTGSDDGTLRLWDTATGTPLHVFEGHEHWVQSLSFSPDGRHIVSGGNNGPLRLWDWETKQLVRVIGPQLHWIGGLAFSPDGKQIASLSERLQLWDSASGVVLQEAEIHDDGLLCLAFNPAGDLIACGSESGSIYVWDPSKAKIRQVLETEQGAVHCVAFSPDGRHILSGGGDGTARIWDIDGRELLRMRSDDLLWHPEPEAAAEASAALPETWQWVSLDFRTDPRGLWSGQGHLVDTVHYVDTSEQPQPWPWIPRYWRASDVPELRASDAARPPGGDAGMVKPRKRAQRKPKA